MAKCLVRKACLTNSLHIVCPIPDLIFAVPLLLMSPRNLVVRHKNSFAEFVLLSGWKENNLGLNFLNYIFLSSAAEEVDDHAVQSITRPNNFKTLKSLERRISCSSESPIY